MDDCIQNCESVIDICVSTGPSGPVGPVGRVTQFVFYADEGTTEIAGMDRYGKTMQVEPEGCIVSINGVMLEPKVDYTISSDGLTVTLSEPSAKDDDVVTVQTWKTSEDSDNAVLDLQVEVENNTQNIAGLDVRVTQNEDDIAAIQNKAQSFTTEDIKVAGTNLLRDRGDELQTQKDINHFLDADIVDNTARIEKLESQKPVTDGSLEELADAIEENAQGISSNANAIGELAEAVGDNTDDITSLQEQVNKLPPPTDISELEQDVDEIATQVGKNTLAIADNKGRLDALEEPVSLDDLEEAVEDLDGRVTANESAIKDIKATDAAQQISINDLEADVTKLQNKTVDTSGFALLAEENQFLKPQSVKDGLKITGTKAFVQMDTGTTLEVSNGNFSDSVIDIKRSNGDTAMSFEASGHIRGIKTDENDPSSAVNVQYLEDIGVGGGGDHDHSTYATKLELKDEARTRELADINLQNQIDGFESYDDAGIKKSLADEEAARIAGDAALNDKIESLELGDTLPDDLVDEERLTEVLEDYATETFVNDLTADFATENFVEDAVRGLATEEYVDAGDEATLEAAKNFTEGEMIGVATEDFVSSYVNSAGVVITESYTQAIADQAEVQAAIDSEQDAELNRIDGRLSAVESVTIDGVWTLDLILSVPRPGEFVLLKGQTEVAATFDEATMLLFSEESQMGTIDFSAVTEGDVFRIATAQGEDNPAGRLSESLAEYKVTSILGTASFSVKLIRSNGTPQDGVDYGARLLSSFDPDGLATLEGTIQLVEKAEENANKYTDEQIAAADYLPTTGGDITGKVKFSNGAAIDAQTNDTAYGRSSFNIRVAADRPMTLETGSSYKAVLRTLAYKDQDGANGDRELSPFVLYANGNIDTRNITATGQVKVSDAEFKVERNSENVFRVQETSIIAKLPVTSHERITANDGILLGGGSNQQNIVAKKGFAGNLIYEDTGDVQTDMRFAWGNNTCWFYKQVDMQQNKIIGCGNADLSRGKDVVNVNTLNAALADVGAGDAVLANNQTFTGINTFTEEMRPDTNTVFNFRGDPNDFKDRHIKVRRGISFNLYAYSGQDNNGAKKVFHCKWAKDEANPEFWMNYIPDPTQNGNPVNLRYANNTYAKKTDVANVPDATQSVKGKAFLGQVIVGTSSNPTLKEGQCYFNRSKKRLYIGF